MQFNPEEEQDIRKAMLLEPGEYDFQVQEAEDKTSKQGNEMIALNLKVYGPDGGTQFIRDWIVYTDSAMNRLKLRRFCEAADMLEAYRSGHIDAIDCVGRSGRVKIAIRTDDQYGPQNCVRDYVVPSADEAPQRPEPPRGVPAAQSQAAMKRMNELADASPEAYPVTGFPPSEIPF